MNMSQPAGARLLAVFTAANPAYEPFVLPYVASVLHHNPEATVEICLSETAAFLQRHAAGLAVLEGCFPGRFLFREGDFTKIPANSVRFVEVPLIAADYVYIGDIDVLVLEPILQSHLQHMERTGLPYSNIKRPGKNSLSGLHFSRWDAYYPQARSAPQTRVNLDEAYLYDLLHTRGLQLPDPDDTFRPLHGFHLSLNRDPRMPVDSWGGVGNPAAATAYALFRVLPMWTDLFPHLDDRYKRLIYILDVMIAARFPKVFSDSPPFPPSTARRAVWDAA